MTVEACAALVERADPDRFLAAMASPPGARAALFPLYAFNVEISRAPWASEEPMIAEMRLQWWRDAIEEIGQGAPPKAHEVVQPLAEVIRAHDLPLALFDEAIAARRWDIYREPFEDEAHLSQHLDHTSGHLMWLAALGLGAPAALEAPVRDIAWALGVANWLRAVPELEARGRVPLVDGRPEGVRGLAGEALARLRAARGAGFGAAMPAVRAAWLAGPILRKVQRDPSAVVQGRLMPSEFARRARLVWKAALGGW